MNENIFLWHWENFLIKEKFLFWKKSFLEKYWDFWVEIFDGNNDNFKNILDSFISMWFFSEKKIVFIKNLPPSTKDKNISDEEIESLEKSLEKVPENILLVFISPSPDKRKRLFKIISKIAKIENFPHPDRDLQLFTENLFKKESLNISKENIKFFLELVWKNLFTISNEIKKLKYFKKTWEEILEEDIKKLIWDSAERNIFKILSLISAKKNKESFLEFQNLMKWWGDIFYIFNLIIRQIRLLIWTFEIKDLSSWEIWKALKIPPFTASAIKKQVLNFDLKHLKSLHFKLYEIDKKIKKWIIKTDTKWNKMFCLALEKEIILEKN